MTDETATDLVADQEATGELIRRFLANTDKIGKANLNTYWKTFMDGNQLVYRRKAYMKGLDENPYFT